MKFRYARHTRNLKEVEQFYKEILNFEKLGGFENHNGYDGIFLGKANLNWHLEFTSSDDSPKQIFDEDDLLVFYPEKKEDYLFILEQIKKKKIPSCEPKNPYWKENGILIKDPDNFGIIISKQFAK